MSFGLNQFGGHSSNYDTPGGSVDPSTPWAAIAEGNLPLLQQSLRQLQYPIHVADEIQGYTLLQAAASYNHMHILQYVWSELQQCNESSVNGDQASITTTRPTGGYQNAVDLDGDTALHYAGSVEVMKFLTDICHIDINITNHNQMTALDAKRNEMQEIEQDIDDFDEDDIDYVHLKDMVQFGIENDESTRYIVICTKKIEGKYSDDKNNLSV
jgi:ankyrin repeat protein